jgi:hypothetical protein
MSKIVRLATMQVITLDLTLLMGSLLAQSTVSGVVTDPNGSDVAHALVEAVARPTHDEAKGGTVGDRPNPWIQADGQGKFTLNLAHGRYKIRAKAESEGYPDPVFLLSTTPLAKFPEIIVGESDLCGVGVTLGPRGGVLEGNVRDDRTKLPIVGAKITISDAHKPVAYVEVFSDRSGHFQFTVPAKPVCVSVTAKGHRNERIEEFALSGGQRRNVQIDLAQE